MAIADGRRRLRVRANADTPGPVDERARARRRGHRPVPHRAHVPRRGARGRGAADDLRRHRRGGAGRLRRPPAAPARRLRRHLQGDERPAGHGPPPRPAAARVPAEPGRRSRSRSPCRGAARTRRLATSALAGRREAGARARSNELHEANPMLGLRGVRLGHREAGPVRDAGPRDLRGRGAGQDGGRRPEGRDHDPARRDEARARADARGARAGRARRPRGRGGRARAPRVGDDDRAAASDA